MKQRSFAEIIGAMVSSCHVPLADLNSGSALVASLTEAVCAETINNSITAQNIKYQYRNGTFSQEDVRVCMMFLNPLYKLDMLR